LADSGPFPSAASTSNPKGQRKIAFKTFVWLVLLLVALGIVRSAITTRLDGFTLDEAYHIAAGVSYVKYGDFRINPEHPPLVKLWVGSVIAATGFHLDPLRRFSDKPDERTFTERNLFRKNDPDSVQRRARAAMFALSKAAGPTFLQMLMVIAWVWFIFGPRGLTQSSDRLASTDC
jgi:hypothetical protein